MKEGFTFNYAMMNLKEIHFQKILSGGGGQIYLPVQIHEKIWYANRHVCKNNH